MQSPDNSGLPSGHDALRLRAMFVPEGMNAAGSEVTQVLGSNPVMVGAVWVLAGSALPGYPYEHIGGAVFVPDGSDLSGPGTATRQGLRQGEGSSFDTDATSAGQGLAGR